MNIKLTFTIIVSKLLIKACRLFKLGGTTLPGKIARKIHPNILPVISKNFKIIMVTGTNGKTTTTKIISKILKEGNIKYITNASGANLVSGITTTLINAVNFRGYVAPKIALLEIDEAAFHLITNEIHPQILVVTNFFRDQLDRYGELYTTLRAVQDGVNRCSDTTLILNGDDSLCSSLGNKTDKNIIYYGLSESAYKSNEESLTSDAMFCIYCKEKYIYSYYTYGHLGGFSCEQCGYTRPSPSIECVKLNDLTTSFSNIDFSVKNDITSEELNVYSAKINLPGIYNIYNSLAAISCGVLLDVPMKNIINALESFESGFGRMETINVDNKAIKLILVKNPTGFNQVINYLLTEEKEIQLAIIINDNLADGTDISWLWDVDFEKLVSIESKLNKIYTSGDRCEDMSVRLKYAGISNVKIHIQKDYKNLISEGLLNTKEGHSFYILPTYTAMLDVRKLLKKKYGLKEFWK